MSQFEPATEEAVLAVEERLGVRLPPAYRNFLLTGAGWDTEPDPLGVDQIGWFAELEAEILAAWSDPDLEYDREIIAVLERCLLIADDDGGAGHYLLLHAGDVAENGEWTAYSWWPGDGSDPEPYDTFTELMESQRNAAAGA